MIPADIVYHRLLPHQPCDVIWWPDEKANAWDGKWHHVGGGRFIRWIKTFGGNGVFGSVLIWILAFGFLCFWSHVNLGDVFSYGVVPTSYSSAETLNHRFLKNVSKRKTAADGNTNRPFTVLCLLLKGDHHISLNSNLPPRRDKSVSARRPCGSPIRSFIENNFPLVERDRIGGCVYQIDPNAEFTAFPKSRQTESSIPIAEFQPLTKWGFRQGYLAFHHFGLPLHQFSLGADLVKGLDGSNNTPASNENENPGTPGSPVSILSASFVCVERPSRNLAGPFCFILCVGGFYWCLYVIFNIYDKRPHWGSYLIAAGLTCSAVGACLAGLFATNPYTWGLPPQWLPADWLNCQQSQNDQQFPHGESVSQKVLTPSYFAYYNKYMANVLSADKQIAIISSLCEGSSIRSIERITGVHRDTIMRLGVRVGQGCTALMDAKMRNLDCHRLEMDEIWGYVGKKEKHLRDGDDPTLGNVWTYCVIDADTKLVPTFKVAGDRDVKTTTAFVADVADRMKNRVQISTDGLKAYVNAMGTVFDGDVDYGQIVKTYGIESSVEAQRRYSAPKITASEKKVVFGRPDMDLISTSYVERLNATTRLHMKRLARLTHAFSKKRENFEAAVGLHFVYYNFVRRHNTLRCTPAMAAGVERSFWSVGELLEASA